jgi:hypothetical protein
VAVVENHLLRSITKSDPHGRPGLLPYVMTVVLADFIRARDDNPEVPKDVTVLCATQSVIQAVARGEVMGAHFCHLVFDQHERFMRHVIDRQTNPKARKELGPIVDRITSVISTDMRRVPALQMADLFAWSYSHKNVKPHHEWQKKLLAHRQWVDDWYGYDALVKLIPGVASRVRSWGLPPHKPTR